MSVVGVNLGGLNVRGCKMFCIKDKKGLDKFFRI